MLYINVYFAGVSQVICFIFHHSCTRINFFWPAPTLRNQNEFYAALFTSTSSPWISFVLQVTIVVKYFFQFGFFPFNQNLAMNKNKPYHPPNLIGTEKKEGYVHYDLIQLLILFFHRSILKVPLDTGIHIRQNVLQMIIIAFKDC